MDAEVVTSATLMWDTAEWSRLSAIIADAPIERRWANDAGDLTPDFAERAGFMRLALIVDGTTLLENETLVRDDAGLHVRSAA